MEILIVMFVAQQSGPDSGPVHLCAGMTTGMAQMETQRQAVHDCSRRAVTASELFVVLGLEDLAATIKAVRADMVTQMGFARGRLDGNRCRREEIVRTMHTALRRGFLVLSNSHDLLLNQMNPKF